MQTCRAGIGALEGLSLLLIQIAIGALDLGELQVPPLCQADRAFRTKSAAASGG